MNSKNLLYNGEYDEERLYLHKFIESIGFEISNNGWVYDYKNYNIEFFKDFYYFRGDINYGWFGYYDLKPIQEHFKKELRSIKIKQLLR